MCLWRYAPPCPSSSAAVSPSNPRASRASTSILTVRISSSTKCRRRHAVRPPQTADPTLSTVLTPPPSRAQTFLRVVYGDDGFFFRRFHAETGECEDAVVPPWEPITGSRVVRFSKRMTVPNPVEKLFGASAADVIAGVPRFEETQWIKYDPARGVASVRSLPALVNSFGKDRFVTEVHVTYSAVRDARDVERCAMVAKLTVSAAGTWGLQHAVEKLMEHRAKSSFREWARWTDDFLSEHYAGDERRDAPLPTLAPFFAGEESEGADGEEGRGWGREGEPRTPARPRRADAFGEDFGEDEPEVDTPPRERDLSPRGTGGETGDECRAGASTDDDVEFDDARSSHSTASFVSARRTGETDEETDEEDAPEPPPGRIAETLDPTKAPTERNDADEDVVSGAVASVSGAVASASVPSPSWRRLLTGRLSPARGETAPKPPGSPRADDAFRDGWFMRTVMKDLSALRASAEDQRATCASLEENVAALRAESAALRAEMRRYAARGGKGFSANFTAHRGDVGGRDDARGWIAWTTVVAIAAAAGVVAATVARRER